MKTALYVIAFILAALIIPFLLPSPSSPQGGNPDQNLPWQITVDETGQSHVFGVTPGVSTLAQIRQKLGEEVDLAIIAAPGEVGSLEAYYNQISLGFVMGRMILTLEQTPEAITAMRERAPKAEHMESTTKKISLHPDDLALANQSVVRAISLIPSSNLEEAVILQRFGEPAERFQVSEGLVHYLYPQKGLDIVWSAKGKEVLQYVAPKNFEASIVTPLTTPPAPKSTGEKEQTQ